MTYEDLIDSLTLEEFIAILDNPEDADDLHLLQIQEEIMFG